MSRLFFLIAVMAGLCCSAVSGFSGSINLYRDTNTRHILALFEFSKSNRCFNLACGDYNDAVSSVKWSGLPTTATYSGGSKAKIVFYVDTDCSGTSKSFSTSVGQVKSFIDAGINDAISSLMVLETSKEIENGVTSICGTESTTLSLFNTTGADDY